MALAFSENTRPKFILIAAISVFCILMGPKTKLRICDKYSKPCNLFNGCLNEPGAGKSPAFELAVESPAKDLEKPAYSVVVHDFTRKGLFLHLTRCFSPRSSSFGSFRDELILRSVPCFLDIVQKLGPEIRVHDLEFSSDSEFGPKT